MDDPRLTPARGDLDAKYLEGKVKAARFVAGEVFEVTEAIAPLREGPSTDAMLLTQALKGERVTIYDRNGEGFAWGQLNSDGYVGWLPDRDALGEYLDSLAKVEPFDMDFVIPSHGNPFPNHRGWIADTRRHHQDRCAQILTAAAQSPRTAHELVSDLWTRPLAPFHHRFAVFEVLAHVEYLVRRGKLTRKPVDGTTRWSAT